MTLNISISFPGIFRQLIRWDNPIALKDGYGTPNRLVDGKLIGQFCMCPVYLTHPDGAWVKSWAENSLAAKLTPANLRQIESMQIEDVAGGITYTVKQKMGWLCAASTADGWGSPINTRGVDYTAATEVKMITAVYAGQPLELTGETMTRPIDINGHKNFELLWRIKAYPPSQWTRATSQLVTAASASNNHTENTKGKIVLPVFFGDTRPAWVMNRWLVPQ